MEPEKSEAEIAKRIQRHVYRAASDPELLAMPWDRACHELVERSMQSHAAASSEAPWFYAIDLPSVLCAAAWELISASGQPGVSPEALQDLVAYAYEDKIDRISLDKALWEVSQSLFPDEKVQSKVFKALSRAYWPALEEALGAAQLEEEMLGFVPPAKELKHAEAFLRKWMEDFTSRAWVFTEQAEQVLTEEIVIQLFLALIAPFGVENPFSCMPGALTMNIGRPPPDWAFVTQAVQEIFSSWGQSSEPSRKRRRAAPSWVQTAEDPAEAARPSTVISSTYTTKPMAKSWGKLKAKPFSLYEARQPANTSKTRTKFKGFFQGQEAVAEEDCEEEVEQADAAADGETMFHASEDNAIGHPRCTSEEDCIGAPDSQLIQHVLDGDVGDIYCEPCWASFSKRNPSLEGHVLLE